MKVLFGSLCKDCAWATPLPHFTIPPEPPKLLQFVWVVIVTGGRFLVGLHETGFFLTHVQKPSAKHVAFQYPSAMSPTQPSPGRISPANLSQFSVSSHHPWFSFLSFFWTANRFGPAVYMLWLDITSLEHTCNILNTQNIPGTLTGQWVQGQVTGLWVQRIEGSFPGRTVLPETVVPGTVSVVPGLPGHLRIFTFFC